MKFNVDALYQEISSLKERIKSINSVLYNKESTITTNTSSTLKHERSICSNRISTLNILIRQSNNTKFETYIDNYIDEINRIKSQIFSKSKKNLSTLDSFKLSAKRRLDEIEKKAENLNPDQKKYVLEEIDQTRKAIDTYIFNIIEKHLIIKPKQSEKTIKINESEISNSIRKENTLKTKPLKSEKYKENEYKKPELLTDQFIKYQWKSIEFRNEHFFIKHNGRQVRVFCKRSIAQFKLVQNSSSNILKNDFITIRYDPNANSYSIEENETFSKIFNYLEIDRLITNYDIQNDNYFSKVVLSHLDNQSLLKAYSPESHTPYLKFLCEIFATSYKIVPVKEIRQNESSDMRIEEYAFLFPIINKNVLYIIWESIEGKRATYIFYCEPNNYSDAFQKIFDYVASNKITNKRDRLRRSNVDYFNNSIVKYYQSINHDNFQNWKSRLNEVISHKR